MADQQTSCCDSNRLNRYLNEQMNEQEERETRDRIDQCSGCQQELESLAGQASLWTGLKRHLADVDPDETIEVSVLSRLMDWLAPTDDPEKLGRIGPYEVCAVIGQGSTGVVFKAFESRLNRFVSIKVLSPAYAASGPARKRFEREGRAVAAVLHENVIPIYAVDEQDGIPYIVMQYIPGMSLLQRIEKDGALTTCEVARIGLQVARGLSAAHDQGIVHRDVKPANVIVENSVDRALVTDFGLARVADEGAMTRTGTIAGTPQYMSPEQAKGEPIDPRSDLFSLGSLLYAASTGRPPFKAETIFGVINRVCTSEPRPVQEINPEVDDWLATLIQTLMTKDREKRFRDAHEVAKVLSQEIAHLQDPVNAPVPIRYWMATKPEKPQPIEKTRSFLPWAVLAVMLLAGFAWLANNGLLFPKSDKHSPAPAALAAPDEWVEKSGPFPSFPETTKVAFKRNGNDWGSDMTIEQRIESSFEVDADNVFTIDLDRGNVIVQPSILEDKASIVLLRKVKCGSQDEAEVLLLDHQVKIESGTDAGVTTRYEGKKSRAGLHQQALLKISLPKGCKLDIKTGDGHVNVGAINADVTVDSGYGDVELDRIGGELTVTTMGNIELNDGASGDVDLTATTGNVYASGIDKKGRIRTSGGHVHLGKNAGSIYVQTSGGNVVVRNVEGKTSAHACDGDVYLKFAENPGQDCYFSASNGDVFVDMYDTVAMNLEAKGKVVLDTSEESTDEGDEDEDTNSDWQKFSWNDAEKNVRVECLTGTVTLNVHETDPKSKKSLGGSGLGGSGTSGSLERLSAYARAKTTGEPRAGAIATIDLEDEVMDGYSLYLPESFDKKRKESYPVIVYLQGAWGVGGPVSNVNKWGLVRLIRDEQDLTSERNQLLLDTFIVVSPHIREGQYYNHPEVVQDIIDTMIVDYNGDPSRVYLTGLSRGGHGTWGLAEKLPGVFAAIVPIASSPDSVKRFRSFKSLPIFIAHNQGDSGTDFVDIESIVSKIEKLGGDSFHRIESLEITGSDYLEQRHVLKCPKVDGHDAWTVTYTRPEIYKWLLQHRSDSGAAEN